MTEKSLAGILADYVYELSFEDLPVSVIERAEISIADAIACAFDGKGLPSSRIALELWNRSRKQGNVTVWVTGEQGDMERAAWVNCLLVHSILHDDMQAATVGHMGSLIVPSALATAEKEGRGGREVLTSIVGAYEVAGRIAVKSSQDIVKRGFRGSPVFGTFATAAACGKLLGLTKKELENAIGLAANFSCGLLAASNAGSMEWRFQNGAALKNGMHAVELAKAGVPCANSTLEGECGFFSSFGGEKLRSDILANLTGITETLGKEFEISKNIFKPHATCGYNQIGVDIVLEMAKRNRIDLGDLESVKVYVAPDNKAYPGGDFHGPFSSIDQALLSKPFSVATALSRGKVSTDIYLSELDSADILELAEKISTVALDGMGFLDTRVEMKLKDGTVIDADQNTVDMTAYSLNKNKVIDKLCELSAGSFKEGVARKLGSRIFDFPEIENVADFFADLRLGLGSR